MPCQCRFGIVTLTCDRSFHDRECPGHRRGWHGKDGGRHEKAAIAFGRRQCCDIHSFGMVTGSAAGLKKTCPSQFLADHLHGPSLTGYDRRRITCCELVTLRGTAYVAGCKVHGAKLMPLDWGRVRLATESLKGWFLALGLTPPCTFDAAATLICWWAMLVHWWIRGAEAGLLILGCLRKD